MKSLKKLLLASTCLFSLSALLPLSSCGSNTHKLTLVNEYEDRGTLTGDGEYKAGTKVTISYSTNTGYKFDKWEIDGKEVTTKFKSYSFTMPNKDITVVGNFIPETYKVEFVNDSAVVSFTGAGTYEYNSEVTVTCSLMKGYYFLAWYKDGGGGPLCYYSTYTFLMPAENLKLKVSAVYME